MHTPRAFPILLTAAVLPLTACGTHAFHTGLPGSPIQYERRGEVAFDMYRIPITDRVLDDRVESGRFRADELWGHGVAAARIVCGGVLRDSRAELSVVELSVTLRLSERPEGVHASLRSAGRALVEGEAEDRWEACQLTPEFTDEILAAVVGEIGPRAPLIGTTRTVAPTY